MDVVVKYTFPDNFEFPENFEDCGAICRKCRFYVNTDYIDYCFITDKSDAPCPFGNGVRDIHLPEAT